MATAISRTMKAAVLMELNQPLQVIELSVPDPGPGQVLVRVMASGICNTQLLEIKGENTAGPQNPNLLGHEGAGIVEVVGAGVQKVKKGDHVILSWIKGSGANVLPKKYNYNGQEINAGYVTTFNEYCLAAENRVTVIPREIPFPEAALIGCAVATGAGVVFNNARVQAGQSVMVVGVGGVGINIVQAACLARANPIIAVDIVDSKLELAVKLGATHTINSAREDVISKIKEIVGEQLLDYAFEAVGRKETMELVYNSVKKVGGKAILCGVPKPGMKIEINPFPLYLGRQIVGTAGGECNSDIDFLKFCRMYLDGKLHLRETISHVLSLHDINQGIELMQKNACCRVVIDMAPVPTKEVIVNLKNPKKKYKVVYDRTNCIGVLTCVAFSPQRWVINEKDAKADLVGGREESPGIWTMEFSEEELEQFKVSAEVCPVNVIKIFDIATGKEIK